MKPNKFKEANAILEAPKDSDNVEDLPVWTNGQSIVSCWEVSLWDRLRILLIGRVWLWVMGPTQPPVFLDAQYPFVGGDSHGES